MPTQPKDLLFICTGNYYRSRFAEALFNHHAEATGLHWRARSRGLNINWIIDNSQLSPHTAEAMATRGISARHTGERRMPLSRVDLRRADRIIALKRTEHYPMMAHQYPDWADHITYWAVDDIDQATPQEALALIEAQVDALLNELGSKHPATLSP